MTTSILTPLYHAQRHLPALVECVMAQTDADWQWVVVIDDDGDYALPDDPRICAVHAGLGSGPNRARNVGLVHCRGDVIVALDGDDWMAPTRIEKLAPLARRYGVAGDSEVTVNGDTGALERVVFEPADGLRHLSPQQYLDLNATIHLAFDRRVITRWPETVALAGDTVFNLDAIERAGGLVIHPHRLFHYRTHVDSHCHQHGSIDKAERGYLEILRLIDAGVVARDPALGRHATELFTAKRATNRAYGEYCQRHGATSFDAYLEIIR
ncbi:glycosyltransferase [Litorivicinus lipolyticus]|uniref:Glycosyltransferase n=1 Tax=Litorivicinus lipolyticus TaxID=418701 RepID=A0A5Q2QFH4_9GAMM|nr:glycosyltransferase family A protein [Litorivicinus lipolyticus]QGG79755.1 glycosyltransferase [Litorivicinus lipolyticus]